MRTLAFTNGIVLALHTIRNHKLRAFLTVLGVIIGTGTIIGVSAILTGFDASVAGVLRSFGPNSIIVFKFPVGTRAPATSRPEERTRKDLTYLNAINIRERCKSVEDVSTMLFAEPRPDQRQVQGQRHVRREPHRRGGGVRARRAGGHSPRPLLQRRGEPAPDAGGGDRAGSGEGTFRRASIRSASRSWWTATSSW